MPDFTSIWAFWQKNNRHLNTALLLLIAFIAGWQISKITSPYNNASPIIFEECAEDVRNSNAPASDTFDQSNRTIETLKEEGIARRQKTSKDTKITEDNQLPTSPQVAGTTASQANPAGKFVGSINSDLFHDPSCSSSKRIKPANQIWFDTIEDAQKSGYSPSKCTQEKLGL